MKTNLLFAILLSILLFFSCSDTKKDKQADTLENKEDGYQILGTIKNVPDSTWIYLYEMNSIQDSTLIKEEKFTFTGTVPEPTRKNIRLKNGRAISFWIENQEIKIMADKEKMQDAIIYAGKIHEESLIKNKSIDSLYKEVSIVHKLYENEGLKISDRDSLIRRQNNLFQEIDKVNQQFIVNNPDSYVSVSSLNGFSSNWGREKVKELYTPLSDRIKKSKYGQSIAHFLSLPQTPKVGEKFIDFKLSGVDGNPIKLSDNNKKYTLIEFWSSWCGPYRKENPNLIKTYNKYKDQGFEIFGVSLDNKKKIGSKLLKKINFLGNKWQI